MIISFLKIKYFRRRGSVVEHTLGKGEVEGSILSGGTIALHVRNTSLLMISSPLNLLWTIPANNSMLSLDNLKFLGEFR
jgi:hypothetical protein